MPQILSQIDHLVVVMLENRSFDNICGWLYRGTQAAPKTFLPTSSTGPFDGLNDQLFNPVNAAYFQGESTETIPIFSRANATDMPNPDPQEDYANVNYQLFGPEAPSQNPTWKNLGFVINYQTATGANSPVQIMDHSVPIKCR